jgi:hypothetical protein
MRVFISSVRVSLEDERDALPGLIRALGHDPVRFEDFTAKPVPSRQACLDALESCDLYLLLLGPHYGHVFPESGQSATHDEWADATRIGLPRYVFRKAGIDLDEHQMAFVESLGDYGSGRFYSTFKDAAALQSAVAAVLREAESAPTSLSYRPLAEAVTLHWGKDRTQPGGFSNSDRPQLEIHVVPLDSASLSRRVLEQVSEGLPIRIRSSGLVTPTEALDVSPSSTATKVSVPAAPQTRWGEAYPGSLTSVTVHQDGAIVVVFRLPGDQMGSILDPQDVTARTTTALRLAGQLDVSNASELAIGIGLTSGSMVSLGTVTGVARNSGPLNTNSDPIHVEPDEGISRAALDRGADEVASSLGRALIREFGNQGR